MEAALIVVFAALAGVGLAVGVVAAKAASRPRPSLPANCGDCLFMVPRNKVYRRDTIEDEDGLIHYLCQKRWIEVTPVSPRCELGRSKSRVTVART
jgi:hypothetical protein